MKLLNSATLILLVVISYGKRPLPAWYDDAKFGVMLHWGVYSVPSYGGDYASEWFWKHWKDYRQKPLIRFMQENYRPGFNYADFAPQFSAEFYDPNEWVDIVKSTGAKYVVMTSKHHEGFCNWPTNVSFSWRSVDVGPKRDLLGDFVRAVRSRSGMKVGIYHSLYEWFNDMYLLDKANNFSTKFFSQGKTIPELHELVELYKPSLIWSDGEWEAPADYWNSQAFVDWLYTQSPVKDEVVINNRWGANGTGPQGDFQSFENNHQIIYKHPYKWENAIPLDPKSWGLRREASLSDYLTSQQIIRLLVQAVSMGGNFVLNVGPTADGRILPLFQERLQDIGKWLSVNGEAIYGSELWTYQVDKHNKDVWYTKKKSQDRSSADIVYGTLIENWPGNYLLELSYPIPQRSTTVELLGYKYPLAFSYNGTSMSVKLPNITPLDGLKYAWTLKFKNFKN